MNNDNIFDARNNEDGVWEQRINAALRSVPLDLDPAVVAVTQARVLARARELREQQEHLRPLWVFVPLSLLWMLLSAPYAWTAFEWMGRRFALGEILWRGAFIMWWFLPAIAVAALLLVRAAHEEVRSV